MSSAFLSVWLAALQLLILAVSTTTAQNLEEILPIVGGTFCRYLAYKGQIHRKFFRDCGEPACNWDDWSHALNGTQHVDHPSNDSNYRIVLSYSHNGFGNQLWEHSVAFMIAEALKARLMVAVIPDTLSPGGFIPPNTWSGMSAMERLLPSEFLYESLPANSPIRSLCEQENFYVSDRPIDWRDKNYSANFKPHLYDLLKDNKPRCLKLLGYYQNLPLCREDARKLWTDRMLANFTARPGPNDISIYLRCLPRHYHFNDKHYYEAILNRTTFDKVWLFQAPECPNKLSDNPAKDGIVASVVRLLRDKYNASRWPEYTGSDDTTALLHDLAGLASSKKLILPLSSWAFWAGMLSNATEIHVNGPPLHPLMPTLPQYIYHNEKARHYYGRYNSTENDIVYSVQYDPATLHVLPGQHRRASDSPSHEELHSADYGGKSNFRKKRQGLGVEESWLQYSQHMYSVINRIEEEQGASQATKSASSSRHAAEQHSEEADSRHNEKKRDSAMFEFIRQFIPNFV